MIRRCDTPPAHATALVVVAGLLLATGGCSSDDDAVVRTPSTETTTTEPTATEPTTTEPTTTEPTTTEPTTTEPTTTEPTTTEPTAADAAPVELEGLWQTELGAEEGGQTVILHLRETSYRITRAPNQGTGSISVTGDQIEFFGGSLCDGTGTYRWSTEGDALQLEPLDDDPCSGRSEVFVGHTYARR